MRFQKSRLYISIIPVIGIGFTIGFLSTLLGIGGGFMLIPAMIYLLGMHTSVVVGTSLYQGIFVAINATFWQAYINNTVDVMLAFILMLGGVFGARIGVHATRYFQADQLRFLLASIIFTLAITIFFDLTMQPEFLYTIKEAVQ